LDSFETHITLVVTPLFASQDISDSHEHEDSAVVIIVLLGVVVANGKPKLLLIEHASEFECIFEDGILDVVIFIMPHAVVDD